ncbi:MAG: ribonuclease E/G [Actinobacteria bacterium]|nr:ribonuclease E/G [Actinomycetota bacterium]
MARPRVRREKGISMDSNGFADETASENTNAPSSSAADGHSGPKKRRRGSRGGKNRKKPSSGAEGSSSTDTDERMAQPPRSAAPSGPPRKPQVGDTRPAPAMPAAAKSESNGGGAKKKRRRGGRGKPSGGRDKGPLRDAAELDAEIIERRRGRERNGRPVGRYLMCVQVRDGVTQAAVMEGRSLIEHYVSRPADDVGQIHGNIYIGQVQNVLPGMEAAFVDISTPKNAVLYRGDVQFDGDDVETKDTARIEHILRSRQMILCQVTKNPIGAKGARLTQEVSLPGRFVVLIPNSKTYGISKRLDDSERRRLRHILDRVKPAHHGVIVRTAAEHATEHELTADMTRLLDEWAKIEEAAKGATSPKQLYREPELAVRTIREEFNAEYRGVVIDDRELFEEVRSYVADFKPSGGSLIIEHTEALTVIDVNTGKNVGTSNLEQTVFQNNLEAAQEVAHQLRLRDIGGIIVIDFIDMEIKDNRRKVIDSFRQALSRDKTRTQVFDISELGLVEMTRKRIGEGLLTAFTGECPECAGRGVKVDFGLLD